LHTHVSVHNTSWPVDQKPIEFDCPYCTIRVNAKRAYEKLERLNGIPFRTRWLECPACGKLSLSKVSFDELTAVPVNRRDVYVVRYTSLISRTVVLLGILFCWAPFLGVFIATWAFVLQRRIPGIKRILTRIAFVIALAITIVGIVAVLSDRK
jgi:hypothetical protein